MAEQTSQDTCGQDNPCLENPSTEANNGGNPKKPLTQDSGGYGANPDNGLLVTHVNQTQDLLRLQGNDTPPSAWEDSGEDWLSTHSLKFLELTLTDLIKQGLALGEDEGCGAMKKMHLPTRILHQFESKLNEAIRLYQERSQWLMQHSKKAFGLIKGARVGILIDGSVVRSSPQKEEFLGDLESLLEEQLSQKEQLYVLSFGSTSTSLWPGPVQVSTAMLQELKLWVQALQPDRGSNLLQALRKTFPLKGLDSLLTIMGSCPDQPSEILSDYVQQLVVGETVIIHIVTYKCDDQMPPAVLRNLADSLGARYHCYSATQTTSNQDVESLQREIQAAQSLLEHVRALQHSSPGEELMAMVKEIAKGPLIGSLSEPPKHEDPLTIEFPNLDKSSAEWLKTHSLKAKKLNLYQILAPNAFSPVEEFVPVLKKTVSATVHEKAMVQFEWHDGTMKNLHVDVPFLYDYQKQLNRAVRLYERRIEWLSLASRRIWGTVFEKRVVILLDTSATNSIYIIHIQHSLRLLLEEQLSNKDCFNLIAFGSTIESWRPEMVAVTHGNLQSAWRWALDLRCQGSRNVLGALRKAVEVDFRDKEKHESQGIYLFAGGIPDQDTTTISTYMAETCAGCDLRLNVCLFYVDETQLDTIPPACYASRADTATAYREVTRAAGGRFHWFGDSGIFESDDIDIITSEMETALDYSQKCALLVSSLKNRAGEEAEKAKPKTPKHKSHSAKASASKPSSPSGNRTNIHDNPDRGKMPPWKTLTWHPLGKAGAPPAISPRLTCPRAAARAGQEGAAERRKSKTREVETSLLLFYTELGNSVGAVYKKYPLGRSIRRVRSSSSIDLPKKDTVCSSQQWLANYGLRRLRMEISNHIGPRCTHQNTAQSSASAKHCSILPSIKINGVLKHSRCTLAELDAYIACLEKLTRRYVQRLQWLLSGSRQLFGTVVERRVCVLLDTSGSVSSDLPHVKTQLTLLVWEQLRTHCDSFNLLGFADGLQLWQDALVKTTEEACHAAMQWATRLSAQGSTSILEALLKAFSFPDVEALYLLTDGKPNSSCSLVLRTVQRLREERDIKVHTISLNCSREEAKFLRSLASVTGGRYHCPVNEKSLCKIRGLLTKGFLEEGDPMLPQFEGDDLRSLAQEITKARNYLRQAQSLRAQLQKKTPEEPKDTPA